MQTTASCGVNMKFSRSTWGISALQKKEWIKQGMKKQSQPKPKHNICQSIDNAIECPSELY